ncbi:MAG: hypothetical protein H7Y13_12015 [Sphingobacteriaceae bacterium]|nr:hypothetical protein [Sphingobacteriaceae bacterium]
MEILNQLTEKLENLVKLQLYLSKQIDCHTNLVSANEALLNLIPKQFLENDYQLMQSMALHNVMKAELKALHHEAQMVELQISSVKTELGTEPICKSWIGSAINEEIQEAFFSARHHTIYLTLEEVCSLIHSHSYPTTFKRDEVRRHLGRLNLSVRLGRFITPAISGSDGPTSIIKVGRCYEFRIEDFFTQDSIKKEFAGIIDYDTVMELRKKGDSDNDTI